MNTKPISTKKSDATGRGCMVLFGLVFASFGVGFFWMTSINPLLKSRASSNWPETQCMVVVSEVDVDVDDDGPTYRPRVEFDYAFDGQNYHSETFDFTALNRSRPRCQEIVNAHPVGMRIGCFVNPNNPEEAVINRTYDFSWFGFLFPLIFAAIGTLIALAAFFATNKKADSVSGSAKASSLVSSTTGKRTSPNEQHPEDIEDENWDEPQKLKPVETRLKKLCGALAVALFWNSIVGFLVYGTIKNFDQGFDWFGILFMVPFVLVGLGLIGGVIYLLAALLNPTVELALSSGAVARGNDVDVAWQLSGRTAGIRTLKVTVEGEESATYRRGTDTITATNVFCSIPVTETSSPEDIEFGSETITIPAETMHTFSADRNNIAWRIVLHGAIPMWPDVKETFDFRVKP